MLIALTVLLIAELAARIAERAQGHHRDVPTASPDADGRFTFMARAWLSRLWSSAEPVTTDGVPLVIDEQRIWALPPGAEMDVAGMQLRTNAQGMRGGSIPPRMDGEVRLLTLGDSSIFGHGVDETEVFSVVAAEQLSAGWGRPVLSFNGAVPGHDSRQSLATLRKLSPVVEPDWVIIGSMWSDVYRSNAARRSPALLMARGMLRELALYRGMRRLLAPATQTEVVGWIDDPAALSAVAPDAGPYQQQLTDMARMARSNGGCPLFLMLPAPMDFSSAALPPIVEAHRAAMRAVAADVGAPLLDGPAQLAGQSAWRGLFLDQVHPSASGHALLGQALAELLTNPAPKCSP